MTEFSAHMETCDHCRTHPFDLCSTGARLLTMDAGAGVTLKRHDGGIRTVTGRKVNLLLPDPETLDPFDMAHALSMQCRFVGHTRQFYSVAQHCVLLSFIVPPALALWGLLHDASEAWLGDVSRPLKHSGGLDGYKAAEVRMMAAVCVRFGLPLDEPDEVKRADEVMLATEQRDVHPSWNSPNAYVSPTAVPMEGTITPWSNTCAREVFVNRLRELGVTVDVPEWANNRTDVGPPFVDLYIG